MSPVFWDPEYTKGGKKCIDITIYYLLKWTNIFATFHIYVYISTCVCVCVYITLDLHSITLDLFYPVRSLFFSYFYMKTQCVHVCEYKYVVESVPMRSTGPLVSFSM